MLDTFQLDRYQLDVWFQKLLKAEQPQLLIKNKL